MAKKTLEALLQQREGIDKQLKVYDTRIEQIRINKEMLKLKIEHLKAHLEQADKGIQNTLEKREAMQQKRNTISYEIEHY